MTNVDPDSLGEATPPTVAEAAASNDDDVVVGTGEDSGVSTDPPDSIPGDQADAVMT